MTHSFLLRNISWLSGKSLCAGQNRRLKMRLPVLRSIRRPSLTKEPFEGVLVDHLQVRFHFFHQQGRVISAGLQWRSVNQSTNQPSLCHNRVSKLLCTNRLKKPSDPPEQQGAILGRKKTCTVVGRNPEQIQSAVGQWSSDL